jgi:hypothetical protein
MEGPSLRNAPRLPLTQPVVVYVPATSRRPKRTLRCKKNSGNLSAGGLLVQADRVPVGAAVRVRVGLRGAFEADGVVRFAGRRGLLGIEFTEITPANRRRLDRLIAQLMKKEVLAS